MSGRSAPIPVGGSDSRLLRRTASADRSQTRVDVWPVLALVGFVLLCAARIGPVLLADRPLGDGGLFTVMANDLRANGFAIPHFTSYNDGTIPFVYPPLGIYLLALIPADPIQTERWLPLLYSYVALGGIFLVAREMAGARVAVVATAVAAAMPVTWAIEGGGVTRGLGFALLLLTWWRGLVLVRQPSVRNVVLVGILASGALLSHPSVGPAGVATLLLFGVLYLSRPSLVGLVAAAALAALLVAPWLISIVSTHGVEPLIRGATAREDDPTLVRLLTFGPSGLTGFDPILPAAVIGVALSLRDHRWLVPLWLGVLLLVPGGDGRFVAVAWALLAAEGGLFVYDALGSLGRPAASIATGLLVAAAFIAAYQQFQPVERVSLTPGGGHDPAVEWWPVVTGGSSDIVKFGYEWTDSWELRQRAYDEARR